MALRLLQAPAVASLPIGSTVLCVHADSLFGAVPDEAASAVLAATGGGRTATRNSAFTGAMPEGCAPGPDVAMSTSLVDDGIVALHIDTLAGIIITVYLSSS